jgi:RNA polymerase sigma-70 factor (ECF subfamily)
VLRFHLDWSLEQIAAALGVPVGTVKSRLHRALSSLRETLGGDHES